MAITHVSANNLHMHLGIGISERNYLNLVTAVELCLLVLGAGAAYAAVAACSTGLAAVDLPAA